ncbi:thiamine pyrophosphate-dependent enzyme [Polaromonas sp. SM01]|uniref:thiamine pyrophosphate-dependent enzyme n=1 Tax=Polaromonas sp. SM01 TaxID=3085630 RepID=UPI00298221D3|nr:thiamine pyrophosphate-dependent enzyme [Polaromonas sp. SM01]MDW5441903.1 thiamine pyrophosphate-binding protein [Polaromonas sp. SM01]
MTEPTTPTNPSSQMTGGEALAQQLVREGVRDIFGVPGVQLDWAVDALAGMQKELRFIVPRHEQATSYMADGYARSSGRVGVSMVVPGPGMLNALSGLATGYACSSRMLFLTAQIPSDKIGRGLGMLHELPDQTGILKSLVKWHGLAQTPAAVPGVVRKAVQQLYSGRPRPVGIEIPQDVLQRAETVALADTTQAPEPWTCDEALIERAVALLRGARRPVIVAGGGIVAAGASAALARLAERLQAPVLVTENGTGALSSRHPLALNWLSSRALLPHADVVLAVGSRFIDPQGMPLRLRADARLILVNAEAQDLGAPREPTVAIHADARTALEALVAALEGHRPATDQSQDVQTLRDWTATQLADIAPQCEWLRALRKTIPDNGFLVSDLTQVGYPAHLAYPVYEPGTFISAGYQGTLGYAYATALGVAAAHPDRAVVAIAGDGGFGWTLQELATARRYQLPVVLVVFNNEAFGNVRLLQERQFGRSYATELTNPDFMQLAKAFGVDGARVSNPAELSGALASALAARRPALIEARTGALPSPWHLIRGAAAAVPNPLGIPIQVKGDTP